MIIRSIASNQVGSSTPTEPKFSGFTAIGFIPDEEIPQRSGKVTKTSLEVVWSKVNAEGVTYELEIENNLGEKKTYEMMETSHT